MMTGNAKHEHPGVPGAAVNVRRLDAARHLLHPQQLKDSVAFSPQLSMRNAILAGLQAAVTAGIALPLFHLSAWAHLIGFGALGALVALFGRFAPSRRRMWILFLCGLSQVLAVFVMSLAAWLGAPMALQLLLLTLSCGLFLFVGTTGGFGAPGPLIFVFAAGASLAAGLSFEQVIERTTATAIVSLLAWLICAATEIFRHRPSSTRVFSVEPRQPARELLRAAARSSIGAGLAIFLSVLLGANHPAWAALGALAVMQSSHLHITMNRALQRMAGTLVGATLTWLILSQDPTVWAVIGILIVLQLLTEMVIGLNYAIGQMFVTPMALLMTYLGSGSTLGTEIASERVLDTLLGATVGIGMAVLLSTIDDRRRLAALRGR